MSRARTRKRGLSDTVVAEGKPKNLSEKIYNNWWDSLGTKPAWEDHLLGVLGGMMYVMLPTAIECIPGVDITGWKGLITSVSLNMAIGGAFASGSYMAGTMGAASAHLIYSRGQDAFTIPYLKRYAWRFNPLDTTSAMSDDVRQFPEPAQASLPGMLQRSIGGETVHLYPPSPNVARVALAPDPSAPVPTQASAGIPGYGAMTPLPENYQRSVAEPLLKDNFQRSLTDNFQQTLTDNFQKTLADNFQQTLSDPFSRSLQGAMGGWGNQMPENHLVWS